jgi:MOSC domain-containing protein YiiM
MEDAQFVTKFRAAERPGAYCRVLQAGYVQAGQAVEYVAAANPIVSVLELFRDYYAPAHDGATVRRFLSAPIAVRSRAALEKRNAA